MINKTLLKSLRNDIDGVLETIGKKHNVVLKSGNCRYTESNATLKIEIQDIQNGVAVSKERAEYELLADMYGLKKEWLDKTFRHMGDTYKVVGLKTRKRKFPVIVENDKGKRYGFDVETIKVNFEMAGKIK